MFILYKYLKYPLDKNNIVADNKIEEYFYFKEENDICLQKKTKNT